MKLGNNYLVLLIVYFFTIVLVFYCSSVYKNSLSVSNSDFYNDVTSSRYDVLYNNIYNYSLEHSDFKIYVSNDYEVVDDEILFLNSDKVSSKNLNKLFSDFGYSYNINKGSVPFYIVFKDGRIKEIVHG